MRELSYLTFSVLLLGALANFANCQKINREFKVGQGELVEIVNPLGRIDVSAIAVQDEKASMGDISFAASVPIREENIVVLRSGNKVSINARSNDPKVRIDLSVRLPERTRVKINTNTGEARVSGNLESIEVISGTGTIILDIPTVEISYEMIWTESRPRFLSDFGLDKVKEGAAGKFTIKGHFTDDNGKPANSSSAQQFNVSLRTTTSRGIVLLNVPPNEVMSDLRERPLTKAAQAIIRSGDTVLMDAIRRASPKYFGDYAKTLPPLRREPAFTLASPNISTKGSSTKVATLQVSDQKNRAISGLTIADFEVTESGEKRDVLNVGPSVAPVNLVLLLDVSGSVDNYVNFIRKAARAFIETVDKSDKVAIIVFNEDVATLVNFTTDRRELSKSLDAFDAGGGTAYFDAIGFVLTETLRPLRGERTAVVILTDGDDNRSFLPFDSLAGAIEESGAILYPLYVPTSLIANASAAANTGSDPLRSRYLSKDLSSEAEEQGKRLADISGGIYYPISQLSQIQSAYDDINIQLRTAYDVSFRSDLGTPDGKPSPKLRIRTRTANSSILIRSVKTIPR